MRLRRLLVAAVAATLSSLVALPGPVPAVAVTTSPILFGLNSHDEAGRKATELALGKRSALVGTFCNERTCPDFYPGWASRQRAAGAVPVIAWDPTPGRVGDAASSLRSVLARQHDAYITRYAKEIKAYGHPVMIRLYAEMNGNWEPYSPGVNGNKVAEFVPAWKHVVGIFRANGVGNVLWVWNPSRVYTGSTPLRYLWPGATWVNWVGLDIYNWGSLRRQWLTFDSLMYASVKEIRSLTAVKPLMINEFGCHEYGGSKSAWLTDMFAKLGKYRVKAVLNFDYVMQGANWRLTSSSRTLATARTVLRQAPITGAGQVSLARIESFMVKGYWT